MAETVLKVWLKTVLNHWPFYQLGHHRNQSLNLNVPSIVVVDHK